MHTVWKGVLAFGLVVMPIRLYRATEPGPRIRFHQLHADCHTQVAMRPYCPTHGGPLERGELERGAEIGRDQYAIISEAELAQLPSPARERLELEQFVPAAEARAVTRFGQTAYYSEPDPIARRAYALLREILAAKRVLAIGRLTLRDRERLVAVEPMGAVLLMTTLAWPDEIRAVDTLDLPARLRGRPRERLVAEQYIDGITASFEPAAFRDTYGDALEALIASKAQPIVSAQGSSASPALIDLMAALEASVAEARGRRPAKSKRGAA